MKYLLVCIYLYSQVCFANYLFTEKRFSPYDKWYISTKKEKEHIKHLLRKLIKSETGKELISMANDKAQGMGKTLYDVLKAGNGSLTDTTLIRKFSPSDPKHITYLSESKVYINKDLTQLDALLDMAHELTHFVYRQTFNPYKKNFSLSEFIVNTIEGHGGEAQAFLMECKVLFELFPNLKDQRYNCHEIENGNELSFTKAVNKFYQLGGYFDNFKTVLEKHGILSHFPKISSDKASFVSSAYGIPYPVAAFEEYLTVINKVCENDKRRLAYLKQDKGRSIASINSLEADYNSKCMDTFN